jgi:hypothetical protein
VTICLPQKIAGRTEDAGSRPFTAQLEDYMGRFIRYSMVAMLALAVAPAALLAQAPVPAEPNLTPEVQGWLVELQEIQAELVPVQQQALEQTPALQEEQQQVSAAVQQAMLEIDPTTPQHLQRVHELQREAQAAQAAGDMERIVELTVEAQGIQQHVGQVQAEALQHPEVAPQVEAFQTRLQARMTEIDPQVEARIQRLVELERQLDAVIRQR